MGWERRHKHAWLVCTEVQIMVEAEVEDRDDMVAEVPFCAWICKCGAWRWRVSPEVLFSEGLAEL